jgi:hypothetical protein
LKEGEGFISIQMEVSMMENGVVMLEKEEEFSMGQMVVDMKVSGRVMRKSNNIIEKRMTISNDENVNY